jgi:hippurate hydrolase
VDPIMVVVQIASWQTIVSRNKKARYRRALSTRKSAGGATNVIPDDATLIGTVRILYHPPVLDLMEHARRPRTRRQQAMRLAPRSTT